MGERAKGICSTYKGYKQQAAEARPDLVPGDRRLRARKGVKGRAAIVCSHLAKQKEKICPDAVDQALFSLETGREIKMSTSHTMKPLLRVYIFRGCAYISTRDLKQT